MSEICRFCRFFGNFGQICTFRVFRKFTRENLIFLTKFRLLKTCTCNIIFTRENIDFTPEKTPDFREVTTRNFDTCHFSPPDTPEISRFLTLFVLKNLIFDPKFGIFSARGEFCTFVIFVISQFRQLSPPGISGPTPQTREKGYVSVLRISNFGQKSGVSVRWSQRTNSVSQNFRKKFEKKYVNKKSDLKF